MLSRVIGCAFSSWPGRCLAFEAEKRDSRVVCSPELVGGVGFEACPARKWRRGLGPGELAPWAKVNCAPRGKGCRLLRSLALPQRLDTFMSAWCTGTKVTMEFPATVSFDELSETAPVAAASVLQFSAALQLGAALVTRVRAPTPLSWLRPALSILCKAPFRKR
jgi:hypothetical protein